MSSQKGNAHRQRPQKHKNIRAFKNDLHDSSHITKKINNLEFYGICDRCKNIIDWKVKYKKYKPLTTLKKCVKCLEKKVKMAYYIVCQDCCVKHKICSKCSKSCEEIELPETEVERRRKEDLFQQELKQLSERQRRKFLRLLEKGLFTKENLTDDPEAFKKEKAEDDELDEEFDEEDDFDEDENDNEEIIKKDSNNNLKKKALDESDADDGDEEDDFEDDEEEGDDGEFDEDDYETDEDYEEEEEEEEIKNDNIKKLEALKVSKNGKNNLNKK